MEQWSIKDFITKFEFNEIGIPEFQRDYEWESSKVKELLDSIYRRYPIGLRHCQLLLKLF